MYDNARAENAGEHLDESTTKYKYFAMMSVHRSSIHISKNYSRISAHFKGNRAFMVEHCIVGKVAWTSAPWGMHWSTRSSRTSHRDTIRGIRTNAQSSDCITITRPDDWHLHVRDGAGLQSVVPHSAAHFGRAIIMPNLVPPVTTTDAALAYKSKIENAIPKEYFERFVPLMTLYLTDNTTPDDVYQAKKQGIVAFKMYPAGATTNSDSGVTDWRKCMATLKAMEEVRW